ncbi:MAG: serine/threonine-protein kinase [Myxococcota bacterium]
MDGEGQMWDTVDALLATLHGSQRDTLEQDPGATIEPPDRYGSDSGGRRALAVLAEAGGPAAQGRSGLRLERTLGEGGMGVVHLAEQLALGRKVAVKTLRPEHRDDAAKLELLREAWVTGALEHPNVVPVYDVSLDDQGQPVIVLKRIEGMDWGSLMDDAERVRETFGAPDLLEWNLQILMQVCNAVSFAHSRGIVHRDLKPENVMVGEFGEVYVLDWGIAVSVRDDGTGRFPLASRATEMAGTPCYMAPEMLGGDRPALSPRTDVYLLGAILYEILTGLPPHDGDNPAKVIQSVLASEPRVPEDAPSELAAICRRAMARDPGARFASAEELRLAVRRFLDHRGSARLAEQAWRRLEELEAEIGGEGVADAAAREEGAAHLYDLFGECRFGFRQALAEWPDNGRAREGLERAVAAMVRHELAQGDPRAASRLLGELSEPPPELAEAVERARRDEDARRRDLEELGRALDPHVGKRTRTFVAAALGALWTLSPLTGGLVLEEVRATATQMYAVTGGMLAVALGLGLWARESLSKTLVNRRIFGSAVLVLSVQLALVAGSQVLGVDMDAVRSLAILLWCTVACMVAVTIDPRFWIVGAGYLATFFATARWPEHYYWLVAAANLNLTVMVVLFSRNLPRYALPPDPFKRRPLR